MLIKCKNIYTEDSIINDGVLEISGETIKNILTSSDSSDIDLSKYNVIAGLIDIHVHGGNGFDCMSGDANVIAGLSNYKLLEGVTSFCPTTVTTDLDTTYKAINAINDAVSSENLGAKILGTFLEGPYINIEYKGAHPPNKIRDISIDEISKLIKDNNIISVAIAPELENGINSVKFLRDNNINIRIGHSGATEAITKEAIESGANIAIHTFNAMRPFNHREIGIIGEVLVNDDIYTEIICDFVHTSVGACNFLMKIKPHDKVVLVTDCIIAGGLCDGKYELGDMDVVVENKIARTNSGSLAGSTLRLIDGVKNLVTKLDIPLQSAINMASINPAKALKVDKTIGSIAIGKKADLVAIDDDFNVVFVMVDGSVMVNLI